MIDWINPDDAFPYEDRCVAALSYHRKNNWPLSAEIIFGIVLTTADGFQVQTWDCTGEGNYGWYYCPKSSENDIQAWCYASEFTKPDFLQHDPHFDMLKHTKDKTRSE